MEPTILEQYPVIFFIEGWLNHLNLSYQVKVMFRETVFDYYLPVQNIAILNSIWKKPISVLFLNKIISDMEKFEIDMVYLIANQFSSFCIETIDRLSLNIKTIDPNCLSDLAVEIYNLRKFESIAKESIATG